MTNTAKTSSESGLNAADELDRPMTDVRANRDPVTDSYVDWVTDPRFEFADEVDALNTLGELGDELRAARKQVQHITRYLHAAVLAARAQTDTSPTAIIGHSGLARQTVYTMLGG